MEFQRAPLIGRITSRKRPARSVFSYTRRSALRPRRHARKRFADAVDGVFISTLYVYIKAILRDVTVGLLY